MSGIICSELYAKSDAKIKSLGNEPDYREILITSMEISETGVPEDRITALERKVSAMEAPVRGLIEDLLDFKAITRSLSWQVGKRSGLELEREAVAPGTASPVVIAPSGCSTVIRPRGAHQSDIPVAPAEPVMARIMQPDGTMKLEIRRGDSTPIDAGVG